MHLKNLEGDPLTPFTHSFVPLFATFEKKPIATVVLEAQ